jgi:hypothetical protein
VAIILRSLVGDPERLPARHDGDAIDRIGAWHKESEDCMAAFVVGHSLALLATHNQRPGRSENDLLQGVEKVLLVLPQRLYPEASENLLRSGG